MKLTKALKFRVHSPEHSKAIQERLFELGASWFNVGVQSTNRSFLYVSDDLMIGQGDRYDYFISHSHQEATLDDLYNHTFLDPTCQAKSVVIDGKKYKLVLDE